MLRAGEDHDDIDTVVAIGPPIMMRACAETTRPRKIRTIVSLNPIMVDGTGMCGGCRVKVGDKVYKRLFAYNENKQAYIADPDAGSYADLVRAAEKCQVCIIHPGKPRNPDEAGLEELAKRAKPFL